jgi:hypothetical protein
VAAQVAADAAVSRMPAQGSSRGSVPVVRSRARCRVRRFLLDEVVEQVGHAQWVFTIPKVLRVYSLHRRELSGGPSRATCETIQD